MVVGGAPDRVPAPLAAERVALFAIDAGEFSLRRFNCTKSSHHSHNSLSYTVNFVKSFRTQDGDQIFIRAGMASGKSVAGVIGNAMPRYCFFGGKCKISQVNQPFEVGFRAISVLKLEIHTFIATSQLPTPGKTRVS